MAKTKSLSTLTSELAFSQSKLASLQNEYDQLRLQHEMQEKKIIEFQQRANVFSLEMSKSVEVPIMVKDSRYQ